MKEKLKWALMGILRFSKNHWREIVVILMFLILQGRISHISDVIENVDSNAARAANYSRNAWDSADEAASNASEAADSASVCEDIYYR